MSAVDYLKNLVSISSVTGEEGDIALYLEKAFGKTGCQVEKIPVSGNGYNILARLPGMVPDELGLLFHGHMDTVAPFGMKDPYEPRIQDNFLWGRGSVDQKGGIAAVLEAFENISSGNLPLKKGIGFIGVIDEEAEHRGSMHLSSTDIRADYAVITEPSSLKIGIGCKGTVPFKITVKGKASHACRPWLGRNAVLKGMEITSALLGAEFPSYKVPGGGSVQATLSLGIMEGGVAYNIVPDTCVLWFDRRLVPGESKEGVIRDARAVIESLTKGGEFSAEITIDRPDWHWDPIRERGLLPALTSPDNPLVKMTEKAHLDITGKGAVIFFTDGYNELDFLINDMKIPSLHYGPGDGSLCHTTEERMDLEQLTTAAKVYEGLIKQVCME